MMRDKLEQLAQELEGTLYTDDTMRTLYATDASAYREMPLAVAIPQHVGDLKRLIRFACDHKTSLIPRTAGTSLAGQVVGNGIITDVSRTFTHILELNTQENWVRVQPGVIRDELNLFLKPHGLYFGPETSTANRAMIGGMVGNNSCGSNSVVYGSTREHLLEVKALLSNGEEVTFGTLDTEAFHQKCEGPDTLETRIYKQIRTALGNHSYQHEIRKEFPKKSIPRRNTGYAVDLLLETAPFTAGMEAFNFCKLIAGSEGTLAFITEIKLHVDPLPPKETGLLCIHFPTIDDSLRANILAMELKPSASELIDHYILECTKDNIEQSKNRFFVQGDPGAILVVEFCRETRDEIREIAGRLETTLRAAGLGYHFPLLFGDDTKKIWALRKAGLGLLSNLPGDEKAVPVIEDTAVAVEDLPAFIRDFNDILKQYNLYAVHYAHAGSGEIHLRPIINLKTEAGNLLFRKIAEEIATLVKKYHGSLSGEHGDGRLRGEFIRQMVGEKNYELLRQIKYTWDPENIFNPNKIVDTPSMNSMLRYTPGQKTPALNTIFHFPEQTMLQHAEQCNGSGDCRKTQLSGGTMCPSYMATRNEKDTTRARANILREFLTHSTKENRFDHQEIYEVLDLCLACKGCKSECPSNVDMAKMKMEFLQHYYDANGVPLRSRLIGNFSKLSALAAFLPGVYNGLINNRVTGGFIRKMSGFAPKRSLPGMHTITLRKWFYEKWPKEMKGPKGKQPVYLFCDEFTNYNDTQIGIKAVQLLHRLGYDVKMTAHPESARAYMSKGLLRKAREIAEQNVRIFSTVINENIPLLGVEPSAILSFRDEYPDLVREGLRQQAKDLARHVYLIDEFLAKEADKGHITAAQFTSQPQHIKLHGHCQQKALSSALHSKKMLSLPQHYTVEVIPSGCCGMAGSFGYEKEHYDLSMQIGEMVLFPAVRNAPADTLIAAPGTSCRHQVKDGTGVKALHPIEILYNSLA
ncbi:FAD-binding and (Fe-S)-binding domain-containing protein [Chitinophaga nivalis]|uniref:FAD-binding protein n=1 Tax=Chitinophaga nivalis TaxID=2991709 RepID=A0ABT3INT6_9BACT|nr:FAD-binding and (Fe-S)-binding domain-containing protein [Chitinophaga nivalis]MCW3464685.1 FAD-binding protein [Chitinophaga nivalis]MCW3485624.1 FAD-binding protein [Chitinophaga nivalis]